LTKKVAIGKKETKKGKLKDSGGKERRGSRGDSIPLFLPPELLDPNAAARLTSPAHFGGFIG
jgi:hypothetical protein